MKRLLIAAGLVFAISSAMAAEAPKAPEAPKTFTITGLTELELRIVVDALQTVAMPSKTTNPIVVKFDKQFKAQVAASQVSR